MMKLLYFVVGLLYLPIFIGGKIVGFITNLGDTVISYYVLRRRWSKLAKEKEEES